MKTYYTLLMHNDENDLELAYVIDDEPRKMTWDELVELVDNWFDEAITFTVVEL